MPSLVFACVFSLGGVCLFFRFVSCLVVLVFLFWFLFNGTACWTMYRSITSSLLWLFSVCAEIERVKRPGESHEGVGRKKKRSSEGLVYTSGGGKFFSHLASYKHHDPQPCHHSRCDPALSVFASKCMGEKLCLNGCTL